METLQLVVAALMGGLAAFLAQQGIAVFNDGLRPLLPEFLEGRMNRRELALTSFALCFGLVIGFGIPFSLTSQIILIHSVFLATDIIGTSSPNKWLAAGLGAAWGVLLTIGLQALVDLFALLPVNFLDALGQVSSPITAAFAVFPALAVALHHGWKKGAITFALQMLARQIVVRVNPIQFGTASINLNAEGTALVIGMILLLVFAAREKAEVTADASLAAVFSDRVQRIKKNVLVLSIMGALVAAAANLGVVAGDPISLGLAAEGNIVDAGIAALARGIGFVPLVATTAVATGVYGPVGMTFVFAAGFFSPHWIVAAILGAVIVFLEVMLLDVIARFLDRFPGVRAAGEHIRTAMTKVLEIALLVGGMIAGNAMAPGLGYFIVAAIVVLNEAAGLPVNRLAIGPVAAILTGILVNILKVLTLFS
ncbi:YhfT family protein [Symbiobacterium thermophilum]|uniref:Putative transport system permease protein n=1 Tax=Symbiobacterium thermophilum (strain DSM 24528 / JCM 14929 / IAM 14863 / T) TaxID=292459 RepID=Q67S00_SYMTH|nr:YhfT family protein [Symbiobacterium thermophilum]BAD39543.1 putative transport system permease protein [Symbiobacterium thermophilum IAM 14863]